MQALSVISQLPETREQQKTFINAAIEEIVNGENDPARVFAKLRIIGDAIKGILDSPRVQEIAMNEVRKYGKEAVINGNKLTVSSRKSWNYEECGDTILLQLKKIEEDCKLQISEHQKFLQTLKPGMVAVDEQTGEQLTPPTFTTTEFIKVS